MRPLGLQRGGEAQQAIVNIVCSELAIYSGARHPALVFRRVHVLRHQITMGQVCVCETLGYMY